jgi:hypothetical protein
MQTVARLQLLHSLKNTRRQTISGQAKAAICIELGTGNIFVDMKYLMTNIIDQNSRRLPRRPNTYCARALHPENRTYSKGRPTFRPGYVNTPSVRTSVAPTYSGENS